MIWQPLVAGSKATTEVMTPVLHRAATDRSRKWIL